jgi:hypothetical protein
MNKAGSDAGESANLDLWRWAQPMPKLAPEKTDVDTQRRRPLRSLRKFQASGMPFLPLPR